ncbi:interferon alpha-inducible protein 27-like protein 2B [Sphaerodactylus townsendi]|uniref:interferon alpha-inducible protein 27-like protein 2B n=1 Tax=Sphaerodactylus townsendi TaxID=933632 RepID=UPI002026DABC|nr:interferon alpha-inducible protein 27-like protein 2B [Sphaerodactylus townsendi]
MLVSIVIGAATGLGAAIIGIPAAVGMLGFTAEGIVTGSLAAKLMSIFAIANGGGVSVGGIVAFLQSIVTAGCCVPLAVTFHTPPKTLTRQPLHKSLLSRRQVKAGLGAAAGLGIATVGIPVVVGMLGFTAAGIAAGSVGAKMMSAAAIANGGGVAAGSIVAVLQSIGAAGLSLATKAAIMIGGGLLWAIPK